MKNAIAISLFVLLCLTASGQCSSLSIQVSSSDTTSIQLYHAGFFILPSGFANVCEWNVSTFSGEIIFEDTTSGSAFEQGQVLFDHSVPLTDSLKATLVITNEMEGFICTIQDTLYWKETEVLPGALIGGWDVLSGNVGVEESITSSEELTFAESKITIYPSPSDQYFWMESKRGIHSLTILDAKGQILQTLTNIDHLQRVDISYLYDGVYFVQFRDENNSLVGVKRIVKQ